MSLRVLFALCLLACSDAFTLGSGRSLGVQQVRHSTVAMGLFDGLKKAFTNEEFKEDDQRVQCRHILLKGDDDVERLVAWPCAPALFSLARAVRAPMHRLLRTHQHLQWPARFPLQDRCVDG